MCWCPQTALRAPIWRASPASPGTRCMSARSLWSPHHQYSSGGLQEVECCLKECLSDYPLSKGILAVTRDFVRILQTNIINAKGWMDVYMDGYLLLSTA